MELVKTLTSFALHPLHRKISGYFEEPYHLFLDFPEFYKAELFCLTLYARGFVTRSCLLCMLTMHYGQIKYCRALLLRR